jgi:methionyl-tRNA synthetase
MLLRYRDGAVPAGDLDPELAQEFADLPARVAALIDDVQVTVALEEIWLRVRRLNRYVEERAPWQLAKDDAKAGELDVTLRSLAEGLRVVGVLLHPYIPATTTKLLSALAAPDFSLAAARFGAGPGDATVQPLDALFPKTPA